ncbi:MAG: hypothetical protein ABL984_05390 [Pyrinomonadaceae bacterium]
MPRNMSFALTQPQIADRSKTVTRRLGWWFLKEGTELNAVNRAMGFKKGERPIYLAKIRVVSVRSERLDAITFEDVIAEGFETHSQVMGMPSAFVTFFCRANSPKCKPETIVNRIEFEYIDSFAGS